MSEIRQVQCEICRQTLVVPPNAEVVIQCPNCFAALRNPHAPLSSPPPLPVIPITEQLARDQVSTNAGLAILAVAFIVGIAALVSGLGGFRHVPVFILLMIGALVAVIASFLWKGTRTEVLAPPQAMPPPLPVGLPATSPDGASSVLEYHTPVPRRGAIRLWPFVGGFFSALGANAAAFFLFAVTIESSPGMHFLIFGGVLAAFVLICFGARFVGLRPGWSGFGRGVAVGMTLGLMAVGPCAGCYLMFAGGV